MILARHDRNKEERGRTVTADLNDKSDFENSDRGFIGSIDPMVIRGADGRVVWDMASWGFLDAECPDTANPSLWRQAQLTSKHGLYEVAEGIYQVRGFEMSNMTLIEGDHGIIVIDPLISEEVAAAAIALYRKHRGERVVTAVIYTHAHLDHFGGVLGVVDADTDVPIVAPEHFLEHAVSENVYAGTAMLRRSYYYAAVGVPKSATGTLGIGLGAGGSTGTPGLIAPTLSITRTGQEETLDGVRIVFQNTPGTECPAEMNFFFPDKRVLCMAENATHNMHNLLTLRGAEVRDPRIWSRYLAEATELFAHQSDVAFASHHWPTWGTENIITFLTQQRDMYAYLHDQTLRLINQGYVGAEIAEMIEMPPELEAVWHTHGYYGSTSHNTKAIYQRYIGWFDGTRLTSGSTPRRQPHCDMSRPSEESTWWCPRQKRSSREATYVSPPSWPATPCLQSRTIRKPGICSPRSWRISALGPKTPPGATASSRVHRSCAARKSSTPMSTVQVSLRL